MLLGFYTADTFISNASNTINPVGELSEIGYTYSRSVEKYIGNKGNLDIFNFGTLTTQQETLLQTVCSSVVLLIDNLVDYNTSSGALFSDVTALLGATVTDITLGNSVLNPVDGKLYPEWIEFTTLQQEDSWTFKIWLVDASFLTQYPLGQFEFINPLVNLQNLFYNFAASKATVLALTPTSLITKAASQIKAPVTGFDTLTIRVFNYLDQTQYFDMPVAVAFNGGIIHNNAAAYLTAFKDALLAGGVITLAQWLVILPSLVPINKYYVVVNWQNAAIINLAIPAPICSPTIKVASANTVATQYFPSYAYNEVDEFLDYTVALYKSVGLYILPALDNLDGRVSFRTKFDDYFLIPLSDINIEQMSPTTQNMTIVLDQLIRLAEVYKENMVLPNELVSIQQHGNFTYVCRTIDSTLLCVITRASALAA